MFLIYWPRNIIQYWQTGFPMPYYIMPYSGEYPLTFKMGWHGRSLSSFMISKP